MLEFNGKQYNEPPFEDFVKDEAQEQHEIDLEFVRLFWAYLRKQNPLVLAYYARSEDLVEEVTDEK